MRPLTRMAAIMIVVIAAIFFINHRNNYELVLRDGKTNEEYSRFLISEGEEFSVTFLHSVNQYPLTDVYEIRNGEIYVIRTIYNQFGAGVQTELKDEQSLEINEDGEMVVSGIQKKISDLSYIVGTVSDHILTWRGKEISLTELCGQNSHVMFRIEK